MSIVINTNIGSLSAQNAMNKAVNSLNNSLKRLSTGYKINSAKDDAAGYYIATKLNSQIQGLKVARQNTQTAGNMLNIAEGDLSVINDRLGRIRDLTVEYASTTLDENGRNAIKAEVQQQVDEINRIAAGSNFNGLNLLDGSAKDMRIQVGAGSDPAANSITISSGVFADADAEALKLVGGSSQFTDIDAAFANASSAAQFIDVIDNASKEVAGRIAAVGAYSSRLDSAADSIAVQSENLTGAYSSIMDADIAEETVNLVKQQLLIQTSVAMLSQAHKIQANAVLSIIGGIS